MRYDHDHRHPSPNHRLHRRGACLAGARLQRHRARGPLAVVLIIDKIEATQGTDTTLTGQLSSDVLTKGTVFEDRGFATMSLGLKNVESQRRRRPTPSR